MQVVEKKYAKKYLPTAFRRKEAVPMYSKEKQEVWQMAVVESAWFYGLSNKMIKIEFKFDKESEELGKRLKQIERHRLDVTAVAKQN